MPLKYFICPDNEQIEISQCLEKQGCRMDERCATVPYLRKISFDREYSGVSPSMAGNGARMIYLKAICDYAIKPDDRVWAVIGIGSHDELSYYQFTDNVLSEEKLSDEQTSGIADLLEEDDQKDGSYILTDYKIWGSFKVCKAIGITVNKRPVYDSNGNAVLIQSGKNKGQQKTEKEFIIDESTIDLFNEEMQLNRYRIFFERNGFPISKTQIQAMPRDGSTYIATSRGITKNIYLIPVKYIDDNIVLSFYDNLQKSVDKAFQNQYVERCNARESWDGRRCDGYCEVSEFCNRMGV